MPQWDPETVHIPFNEAGDINEAIPADLAKFIDSFHITQNFSIQLKKWSNPDYSGRPALPATYEGVIPTYEGIVSLHGPAHYGLDTTWTPKNGKPKNEIFKVSLVGEAWTRVYEKAKEMRDELDVEEAERKAKLNAARRGNLPNAPAPDAKTYVRDLKELNDMFNGNRNNGGTSETMQMMGMMFTMMMKSQENNTQMMIAMMNNNQSRGGMAEQMSFMREAFGLRDTLMPKDKSWVEDVVGLVADNAEGLISLFAKPNPQADPLYQQMDADLTETREKVHEDPNFLKALVAHIDKKVGSKTTDQILAGFLDIDRPKRATSASGNRTPATPPPGPVSAPQPAARQPQAQDLGDMAGEDAQ